MPFRPYSSPSAPSSGYGSYGSSTSSYGSRNSGSNSRGNGSSTSGNLRSSYSPLNSANRLTSTANAKSAGDYSTTTPVKSYGAGQTLGTRDRSLSKDRYNDSASNGYKPSTITNSYMKDYAKPTAATNTASSPSYGTGTSERSRASDRSPSTSTSHSYSTPKKVINDTFLSPSMYTPKVNRNRSIGNDRTSEDKTNSTTSNPYMTSKVSPYKGYTRTNTANYDKTLATPKYSYGRATTRDLSTVSTYARSTSVQEDKKRQSSYGYSRSVSNEPATTPSITVTAIPETSQTDKASKSVKSDDSEEESEEEEEEEEVSDEDEKENVVKLTTRGTSPNRIASSLEKRSISEIVQLTKSQNMTSTGEKHEQESQTDIVAQTVTKTPPTTPTTRPRFIGYTGYNAPSYSTYTPRYTNKYSGKYSSPSTSITPTSTTVSQSIPVKQGTPPRCVTSPARKTPPLSVVVSSVASSRSPSRSFSKSPSPAPAPANSKLPVVAVSKPPPSPTANLSKPPLPLGNAASKEFRKSPLNLNLDDKQTEEYRRKQDELRKAQRSVNKSPSLRKNSIPDSSKSSSSLSLAKTPSKSQLQKSTSKKTVGESRSSSCSSTSSSAASSLTASSSTSASSGSSASASKAAQVSKAPKSSSESRSLSFVETSKLKRAGSNASATATNRSGPPSRQASFASASRSHIPEKSQSRTSSRTSIPNDVTSRNPSRVSLCPSTASLPAKSPSSADMSVSSVGGHRRCRTVSKTDSRTALVDVSAELARVNSRNSVYNDKSARKKNSSSSESVSGTASRRNSNAKGTSLAPPRTSIATVSNPSSESIDSSTSAAKDQKDPPAAQPPVPVAQSSFLNRLTSPFGFLRRNPSEVKAWWLPSTDNVPAALENDADSLEAGLPLKLSSTAIFVGDSSQDKKESSSSNSSSESEEESTTEASSAEEEEEESQEAAATEEEVSDIEGDKEVSKPEIEELPHVTSLSLFSRQNSPELSQAPLGDRTSPDGFEWPTPSTPPPRTHFFRAVSPHDNVDNVKPAGSRVPERKSEGKTKSSRKFIGELKDIDSLLKEPSISESFEDFEARYSSPEKEECHDDDKSSSDDQGQDVLDRVARSNLIPDTSHAKSEEDKCEADTDKDIVAAVGLHPLSGRHPEPIIEANAKDGTCLSDAETESDSEACSEDPEEDEPEPEMLEDAALQLYKDGDYGAYLDLEATLHEQADEFEGFLDNKKNSIVLRTQLTVRVHAIIEKLLNSEGRELRRALFSLKQIFQEDKDLVHEFVQNDGLACLIQVGHQADQNYQNYILRALGQVMLYVDGMNGVMEHNETVQWLYSLTASKYRLVVKTALKLMLVFVEYVETNCHLLVKAIHVVDTTQGQLPWANVMAILQERDASDNELLVYATTLINKTLNGLPDQDSYYDQTDCLEELGMEHVIHRFKNKPGADTDLLQQLAIYEAELHKEDGEEEVILPSVQSHLRHVPRSRRSVSDTDDRRKSRRHSTTSPKTPSGHHDFQSPILTPHYRPHEILDSWSSSTTPSPTEGPLNPLGFGTKPGDAGVTPALRRRRERAERHRSFIQEQEGRQSLTPEREPKVEDPVVKEENRRNSELSHDPNGTALSSPPISPAIASPKINGRKDLSLNLPTPLTKTASRKDVDASNAPEAISNNNKKPWVLSMMYGGKNAENEENLNVGADSATLESLSERIQNLQNKDKDGGKDKDGNERRSVELSREATVKDLTERLQANHVTSPTEDKPSRLGDLSGIISKAKEGLILSKSKSRPDLKGEVNNGGIVKASDIKKSETEMHWEQLVQTLNRPLHVCDMDFTDLKPDDDSDPLSTPVITGIPPPPPPMSSNYPPPPPPFMNGPNIPPPPPRSLAFSPPPIFGVRLNSPSTPTVNGEVPAKTTPKKSKKTVKLFWREVREDGFGMKEAPTIWDEIRPVCVDTQKLEHLFESRSKDLMSKKQQDIGKSKTLVVLDPKRSNAINIGMTKLPPPRTIKTAILKMDSTIINREGIEKLLTMLPTDEERAKIQEAQIASPDVPLGNAEQFLLTLASIPELPARLRLWLFKSDYDNMEKEVAEPLMDLKQGVEVLQTNHTFRCILATLLAVGNFLNGLEVKGFQVEYLAKVPEVKDTVHKHSLLHHLCHMVMETFPDDTTDLYSEIGAVTRASRVDFDELAANLGKMEHDCKASWDYLRAIAKHDSCSTMKIKTSEFLADCAERIIVLGIVHRRILNRFHKFLLYLGTPPHVIRETKPGSFCKIVSEFALEYRTTRERVLQQFEKKASHRERNKTRGKMITEVGNFRNPVPPSKEDRADAELRQLLGSDMSDTESIRGTLTWNRSRSKAGGKLGRHTSLREEYLTDTMTDGDDDILESLVKTATQAPVPRNTPRERKRARQADRKSLRRTLKNGLTDEEKRLLSALMSKTA